MSPQKKFKNDIGVESLQGNHKEFIKSNRTILRSQQRFTREKHNVFTKDVKKIANNNKIIQSIDSIETNAYGTNKDTIKKNAKKR